jgi:SRSO17 transposase
MLPIVTFPEFIENILPRFTTIFSKPQLRHFGEYLTGLVVSPNKTVAGINAQFLDHTNQSSKNHFLTQSDWDDQQVTDERLKLVKEHCIKHHVKDGLLVIDDSGAHKTGHHIEAANWFWDHSKHSYAFGHQLVTSQYVTDKFHVPLHYRLYQKEDDAGADSFKSKLDLAIELIDEAVTADIPFSCVAGDSWYFCDKIIKHLESLSKDWIFACKSNRKVLFNNQWLQLKDVVKKLSRSDFKQITITKTNDQRLTVCAYAKTLRMSKVGRVKVLISYLDDVFVGNPFFLVTNRKEWPIAKMLTVYSQRWPIETFYRDTKQHLGLESCELRMLRGIRRHWDLVFLAYTLLQIESCTGTLSKWIKSNVVTIGSKSRVISCELFRSFIFWAYQYFDQGDKPDQIFKRTFLKNRQLQFNF